MSIFGKSATIYGAAGNNIVLFNGVTAGPLPLPANIVDFQLTYGTTITLVAAGPNNLSNITFTVTGKFNNITITESIQGPDGGDVTSVQTKYYYDKIISIVSSGDNPDTMTLTVNVNSIVTFNNTNINSGNTYNLKKISILASSIGVNDEGWGQGNYIIYGVVGKAPLILEDSLLEPNYEFEPDEPYTMLEVYPKTYSFYIINDALHIITQNELRNGYIVTTEYPFDSIIVNNRNNLIQTPTFISITQS